MKPGVHWLRNVWPADDSEAGWQLFQGEEHLGTVFANGTWYGPACCGYRPGSQPLAAQALLRAVGLLE